ncbi:MAG: acyl carrier protein [Acidobacteria bacterium]|nr:acyl carrier protein [Acidobacteriota bacterium]
MTDLRSDIKVAIVRALKLPIAPETIDSAAPLFGAGLGLDSIDALELVLEIERSFGVVIGDEETGGKVLQSVDAIAEYIEAQRAAGA